MIKSNRQRSLTHLIVGFLLLCYENQTLYKVPLRIFHQVRKRVTFLQDLERLYSDVKGVLIL